MLSDEPAGESLSRRPEKRSGLARPGLVSVGILATVALVQLAFARWAALTSRFMTVDDEGYMVLMIRQWADGRALYEDVYSQYGPFHTLLFGVPLRLFDVTLGFATGRVITAALWVGTALVLALVVLRLTRSIWAALLAQGVVFMLLAGLVTASMHPGALLIFLLAVLLLVQASVRPRRPVLADWLTGVLAALVVLTKINVGIFVVVAIVYLVARTWPDRGIRRFLLPVPEVALVLMGPVLLVPFSTRLDSARLALPTERSTLYYWAATYVVAVVAVLFFSRLSTREREEVAQRFDPRPILLGFCVASAVIVCAALVTGTQLTTLVEAVLIRPTGQGESLAVVLPMNRSALVPVLLLPVLLYAGWRISTAVATRAWHLASASLRGAGAVILLWIIAMPLFGPWSSDATNGFTALLLVSLVVLPRVTTPDEPNTVTRQFLAVLTVGHSLQAFPVAGQQWAMSMSLVVICAVVILEDARQETLSAFDRSWGSLRWSLAPILAILAVVVFQSANDVGEWRRDYYRAEPATLHGLDGVRVSPKLNDALALEATDYEQCDQLVSFPGFSRWYILAEIDPPTGYNTTFWDGLLTDDEQQAVVNALEAEAGTVCYRAAIVSPSEVAADGPLSRYLESEFEVVADRPTHHLLVRRGDIWETPEPSTTEGD